MIYIYSWNSNSDSEIFFLITQRDFCVKYFLLKENLKFLHDFWKIKGIENLYYNAKETYYNVSSNLLQFVIKHDNLVKGIIIEKISVLGELIQF